MKNLRLIILAILPLGVFSQAQHALPENDKLNLTNTEIIWDEWGVPHIYADNDEDLFFAQGWSQMHLHGNLILKMYGQARGKASEYWGEKYLETDILVHTFKLQETSDRWVNSLYTESKRLFNSFVNGINAYAEAHPETLKEENRLVLPVRIDDIMLNDAFSYIFGFILEREKNLLQTWNSKGSNAFAIAPARSASNHAMLVQNPHWSWSSGLYVETHFTTPDKNIYGAASPGAPGFVIAFNEFLGWANTDNTIDNVDIYELELVNDGYLLDGKATDFIKELKTIKIKLPDGSFLEKEIEILWSKHGPVFKKWGQKALALRVAVPGITVGSHLPNPRYELWKLATATNFKEFEEALKMFQMSYSNYMYADKDGNIFYLFNGFIPEREKGGWDYWQQIIKGGKSEDIWTKIHPYEDLPKVKNPDSGWLQNTNDPPWYCTFPQVLHPEEFPSYFSPQGMDFRNQIAGRLIGGDSSITFDELIDYKLSTRFESADRLLDDLFQAIDSYGSKQAKEAKKVLETWDRQAENNSVGTEVFQNWSYNMFLLSHEEEIYAIPWDKENPLTTPDGLADPKKAVKVFEGTIKTVERRYGSLTKPYGEMLRLKMDSIDLPANGAIGSVGCLRVIWPAGGDPEDFYVSGGDSYVGIVEFGDKVKAKVLLSYGNSSQEGSPHRGDQLQLFSEKKLRDAYFYREDVQKHAKRIEVLNGGTFTKMD